MNLSYQPRLILLTIFVICFSISSQAQWTSSTESVTISGTFNFFDTQTPNMALISNDVWQGYVQLSDADSIHFKFATAYFGISWGETNQTNGRLPISGIAEQDGVSADIVIDGRQNALLRFRLNTQTGYYSIENVTPSDPVAGETSVWINELHYDNAGTDVGEAVEIAGPVGLSLSNYQLVFYTGDDGTGTVYKTVNLSGTLEDQERGYGATDFPISGIQNGPSDALALIRNETEVIQFLSYEGSIIAIDGPANGMTATDIGVEEGGDTPIGHSLQLAGTSTNYEGFSWAEAQVNSFGSLNPVQTIGPANQPAEVLITDLGTGFVDVFDTNEVYLSANFLSVNKATNIQPTLFYQITPGFTYTPIPMSRVTGSTFRTDSAIPAQPRGTRVEYYYFLNFDGKGSNAPSLSPVSSPAETYLYGVSQFPYGTVWVNELNAAQDFFSYDTNEFVELIGPAGSDISGWSLAFYAASNAPFAVYTNPPLSVLPNTLDGFGFWVIGDSGVPNVDLTFSDGGVDNYMPDQGGIELRNAFGVPQYRFSYGSVDPGFSGFTYIGGESAFFSPDELENTGSGSNYFDFTWTTNIGLSAGSGNTAQTLINGNTNPLPPAMQCPDELIVSCLGDIPLPDSGGLLATGLCGNTSVTVSHIGDLTNGVLGCVNDPVTILRTYRAVSDCATTTECVQVIKVIDMEGPVITSSPEDIILSCLSDLPPPQTNEVIATDGCSEVAVRMKIQADLGGAGNATEPKVFLRIFEAMDACGNSTTCTQQITFIDDVVPSFTCPAVGLATNLGFESGISAPWTNNPAMLTNTYKRSGLSSAVMQTTNETLLEVSAESGQSWHAGVFAMTPATQIMGSADEAFVELRFLNGSTVLQTSTSDSLRSTDRVGAWHYLYTESIAPATTTKVQIRLRRIGGNTGSVYFDDAVLERAELVVFPSADCTFYYPDATALVEVIDNCEGLVTQPTTPAGERLASLVSPTVVLHVSDIAGNVPDFNTCTVNVILVDPAPLFLECPPDVWAACTPAGYDDASDFAYNDGWGTSGVNGGTNFQGWIFESSDHAHAGHFRASSTGNGDGDGNNDGDIDTANQAWGMYANNGAYAIATRAFASSLGTGSTFRISMDNGWLNTGGKVGFRLRNGGGAENRLSFSFTGGEDFYKITDSQGERSTSLSFTDEGLEFSMTLLSSDHYIAAIKRLVDGSSYSTTGTLAGTSGLHVDEVVLFNENAGSEYQRDAFFNSIAIQAGQQADTAWILGSSPCHALSIASNVDPGDSCSNSISRVYRATDTLGRFISSTQRVTIVDHSAPSITACPTNLILESELDVPAADTNLVSAVDSCGTVTVVYLGESDNGGSGANGDPKIITRSYQVLDECGNFSNCVQTISIESQIPSPPSAVEVVDVQFGTNLVVYSTGTNTWDFTAEYSTNLTEVPQMWRIITNVSHSFVEGTNISTFGLPEPRPESYYMRINQIPPE